MAAAAIMLTGIGVTWKTTTAYLADRDEAVNELNIGNVDITVDEDFPLPEGIEAGDTFKKEVSVGNAGLCDCYVRASILYSNDDFGKYLTMDYDTNNWIKGDDGYWYYKSIVPVGGDTTQLITEVKLADNTPGEAISDLDIIVYCEAWQSEGFDNYKEAWEYAISNKQEGNGI